MKPKALVAAFVAIAFCVGCAGRAANPVMVQQYGDDKKSCQALEREMAFIQSEIQRLIPQTDKTGKNVALGVTGFFFIVPLFFMDLSEAEQMEVNAYRQRYNHLLIIAGDKQCGLDRTEIPEFTNPNKEETNTGEEAKFSRKQNIANQTDRLKSFLFLYCQTYESKDLDKFATLFTPDALENNRPFHLLLPEYRKKMDMIESFNYRIELNTYSLSTDSNDIKVKGKYFSRFMYEGTLKENSGNISMELVENGDSYLVKQLNYTSRPGKKTDKQSQWGPWIEIGDTK